MEKKWFKEILYHGQSGNGFKLGLCLSRGYFWVRRRGCSNVYSGKQFAEIDFANILTSAELEADTIIVAGNIIFESNETYYFVVRNVNSAGDEERSFSAVVELELDSFGNIASPEPNAISEIYGEQVDQCRLKLGWYYNPVNQASEPELFRIYFGAGADGVDYSEPAGTVYYSGRKYYEYLSSFLSSGRYVFDIRAVDSFGVESSSSSRVVFELVNITVDNIAIFDSEVV